MRTTLILILGCLFLGSAAHAWNSNGHRQTAEIAFRQLDPDLQVRVGRVLQAHPRYREDFLAAMPADIRRGSETERTLWSFKRASYWPDLVPNISDTVREKYHRGTWHYINLPAYLTPNDSAALDGKLTHNMRLEFEPPLRQELNVVQALEGNLQQWRDPDVPDADKAVALCWILHLTGDLHQPLHTVALFSEKFFPQGDRGGNSIRIEQRPEQSNLHAVWDNLPSGIDDWRPATATAVLLDNEIVTRDSSKTWVREHFEIALQTVYTDTLKSALLDTLSEDPNGAITLSPDYREAAAKVAQKQVVKAGHRIAALLAL